jgi:O-antigen/teichoic acid export membrane protein
MIRRENRSIRIHWAFDFRIFKRLFFLGFPLFLLTIVEWQTRVGDRAIVALMLGEGVLGYYGLASTFSAALTMIAIQVSQTMQPRIYRRYGETHDVNALKEQVLEPCRAVSRVFPFGIGLAVLGIPLFIRIFLPAYEPAIPIAVGLCLASFFLAVPQTQAALLMALEKQWLNLGIWSVVLAINLGLNFYLLSRGWGMTGVALGTGTSWVICFLLRYAVTLPYHLNWAESVRYVSVLLLPFLYMLIVIGIGKVIFQGEGFAVDAGEILLFLLAYSPILWWANKKYAVWVSLRDYFRTWKERAA